MSVSLPSYTRLPSTATHRRDDPPLSLSPPPSHPPAPHRTSRTVALLNQLKRPQVILAGCAALLVLSLTWNKSDAASSSLRRVLAAAAADDEFQCNPFEANGRLRYDPDVLENNVWVPYDERCPPSNYMARLAAASRDRDPAELAWFANRTIVLHSDSIDRFHMKDFCDFVGGQLANIHPQHPASPPMYRDPHGDAERRKLEDQWSNRPPEGWELTSPWVCDVERYGTTLVNVFQFGLEGGEQFYLNERWYYPPGTSLLCLLLLLRADFSWCLLIDARSPLVRARPSQKLGPCRSLALLRS